MVYNNEINNFSALSLQWIPIAIPRWKSVFQLKVCMHSLSLNIIYIFVSSSFVPTHSPPAIAQITPVIFLIGSRDVYLYGRFNYLPYTVEALDRHGDVISTLKFIVDPYRNPSGEIESTSYPNHTEESWLNTTSPSFPYSCDHFM